MLINGIAWLLSNPRKALVAIALTGGVSYWKADVLKKLIPILMALLLGGCASLNSGAIIPLDFSSAPPRAAIRGYCNGETFTTQGTVVCEQKSPSQAKIAVKVPPLEGRVVYSNGQLKGTEDFNWYPKEGFFIWKKKPLKDTFIDLDLGEIAATYGDWPVALDIMAISKVGLINTSGILYHRICNDQDIPCSSLVVNFQCAGYSKATGPSSLGKCERLSGSPQAFSVDLAHAKKGAVLYVVSRRLGVKWAIDITEADLAQGFRKFEIPQVPNGPTLIEMKLAWWDGIATQSERTTILLVGFDPKWTGLDRPHYIAGDDSIEWVRPVLGDLMETTLFEGSSVLEKRSTTDRAQKSPRPKLGQLSCSFAWNRDASDLTFQCLDSNLKEVSFL